LSSELANIKSLGIGELFPQRLLLHPLHLHYALVSFFSQYLTTPGAWHNSPEKIIVKYFLKISTIESR